jgi:hypothetical protein
MCNGDRDRRLADAACANDGDKARSRQVGRQLQDVVIPADDPAQAAGKIGVREICSDGDSRCCLGRAACTRDRRDEAVATSCESRDVARAILAIAQRLAEARHMKPQAAFFDGDIGPSPRHQVLLADDFIRLGNESDQNVERARTQLHGDALFREEPLARDQIEWTKRQHVFGLNCRRHSVPIPSHLAGPHFRSRVVAAS